MKKQIALLGSTGSIGTQTLDVVSAHPEELGIVCLAARGNKKELLAEQILCFHPSLVVVYDEDKLDDVYKLVKEAWTGPAEGFPTFLTGMEGLFEAVRLPEVTTVVTALVGMIGIEPTIEAIKAGKDIALANKETLACAGELIMDLARAHNVRILPIDSEHGAVFQCLQGILDKDIARIWLTASGGPFRGYTREQLKNVTIEQALKHPNWAMGPKITIDSATLMNKGIEMIESKCLWGVSIDQVVPVVHPQSIVHSMVETVDGSVMAQLGPVDMRLPIEVVLLYPKRGKAIMQPLDFRTIGSLTFEAIDEEAFPSITMARESARKGGLMPACFNAAGELAVRRFLDRKISFLEIFDLVASCLDRCEKEENWQDLTIENVLQIKNKVENWF